MVRGRAIEKGACVKVKHWIHLGEHWQEISAYLSAGPAVGWRRLGEILLVPALTVIVSVYVMQSQVRDIKTQVDQGILPRTDEKIRSMQDDIRDLKRQHETMLAVVGSLEKTSPGNCLVCHMTKRVNHPAPKGAERK